MIVLLCECHCLLNKELIIFDNLYMSSIILDKDDNLLKMKFDPNLKNIYILKFICVALLYGRKII